MRKMITLINREFWEQRGIFFNFPLILLAILSIAMIILFFLFPEDGSVGKVVHVTLNRAGGSEFIASLFTPVAAPFIVILWLIIFNYFFGTLYDDRKDRSVLFWQSMPTSQFQILASKLFAGLVLAPFCTWVVIMLLQLLTLCWVSLLLLKYPIVVSWAALWDPSIILLSCLRLFIAILLQCLWLLPLFAWCMLFSAFAKRAPALIAFTSTLVIILFELLIFRTHVIFSFIVSRFKFAAAVMHHFGSGAITETLLNGAATDFTNSVMLHTHSVFFNWQSFLVGLVSSIILIVAAGLFRRNCYDFD